ncbi:probable pectinesterase 55 [Cucumis sativus]|uniref:probable pectinesterase 55 n=1 Tax=Cucumis sativus TaxID=3659 RepID=UPI0005ECBF5E|nr:probable pectinesterase 55 [Cucumis sativus]
MMEVVDGESENALKLWSKEKLKFYDAATNEAWEKVTIPSEKSCIFLDGSGLQVTEIHWNDHETTAASPTFTASAQNLVVQGITFRNTYNARGSVMRREDIKPALAALIQGDKVIFHKCGFIGLQDTLWDGPGRHLFTQCYIEGVIDVISGFGQSIYKECVINIPVNAYAPLLNEGFITAQGKENPNESSGFVFLRCIVQGSGNVFLGRAYRPFSTVIFHLCFLPSCINPAGWNSWLQAGHESDLTYSETRCIGPGADTSSRVPWVNRLDAFHIRSFTDISYIDPQGYWTSRIPLLS